MDELKEYAPDEPRECPQCGIMKTGSAFYSRLRHVKAGTSRSFTRMCRLCTIAHVKAQSHARLALMDQPPATPPNSPA